MNVFRPGDRVYEVLNGEVLYDLPEGTIDQIIERNGDVLVFVFWNDGDRSYLDPYPYSLFQLKKVDE